MNNYFRNSLKPLDIVRNTTDLDKALRLFKFAIKTQSMLISISTYNHETSPFPIIYDELIENYSDKFTQKELESLEKIADESEYFCLPFSKDEMIFEFKFSYPNYDNLEHFIAFEDSEKLTNEVNQVWIKSMSGLTDSDIDKATDFLKS